MLTHSFPCCLVTLSCSSFLLLCCILGTQQIDLTNLEFIIQGSELFLTSYIVQYSFGYVTNYDIISLTLCLLKFKKGVFKFCEKLLDVNKLSMKPNQHFLFNSKFFCIIKYSIFYKCTDILLNISFLC